MAETDPGLGTAAIGMTALNTLGGRSDGASEYQFAERGARDKRAHSPVPVLAAFVLLIAAIAFNLGGLGPWVAAGLVATMVVLWQIAMQSPSQPPFLHLMLLVYEIQFLLAPLALYHLPTLRATVMASYFTIAPARFPIYFAYVVPACLALHAGVLIGSGKLAHQSFQSPGERANPPAWSKYGVIFIGVGLLIRFGMYLLPLSPAFAFVVTLATELRWVGLFILILRKEASWPVFALILLGLEFVSSLAGGMFYDLVLRAEATLLIVAFRYGWRFRLVFSLVLAIFMAILLQSVKYDYRAATWGKQSNESAGDLLLNLTTNRLSDPGSWLQSDQASETLVRFNQGWIVNRVLQHVPAIRPYAGGSTIITGITSALAPRFLWQDKVRAGGRDLFTEYTGIHLNGHTSMCISPTGEMYANFGVNGGILGMGLFGLCLGLLYRWMGRLAVRESVWWAWAPFILLWALKAEEDLSNIENWIVKALIVMGLVVLFSNAPASKRMQDTLPLEPLRRPLPKSRDSESPEPLT